jgi:UDP-glucose 4-epimerase
MVEQILCDYDQAYGLKSVILRYFNAAGADPSGKIGEEHDPETHLIPLVLRVALGVNQSISIYGDDYKTHDGTCIRDYVHVRDLCQAHWLGLCSLVNDDSSQSYNLGNGDGFSVLEVVDAARSVTNKEINVKISSRRAGDPDILVADSTLAKEGLGWKPEFPEIKKIIEHAWAWELSKRGL